MGDILNKSAAWLGLLILVGCGDYLNEDGGPREPVMCDSQEPSCAAEDFDGDGVTNGEDDFPEDPACATWSVDNCGGCGEACSPRQMCLDTGLCVCSPGFTGADCAQCTNPRFTGEMCEVCSDPHVTGDNCTDCAEGFTGEGCAQCTDIGFMGDDCTECADPTFTGPDCAECADPTFTGADCTECSDPTYSGAGCTECSNPMFTGPNCAECAVEGLLAPDCLPFPDAPDWFYQVHLPEVALDEDGESPELYVDLPEGTTSVFVMVRGEEEAAFYTLQKVITPPPESQPVVKGAGDAVCIPCLNRVVAAQRLASFLVPNDPEILVQGGEWTFKIRGTGVVKGAFGVMYPPEDGLCEVIILARTEPIPETGRLVIQLHFTGSAGLTAETAPDSEDLQTGLDGLTAQLATAGIGVEIGGYHDIPGVEDDPGLVDLTGTIGAPNDFSRLLLLGQDEDRLALNLFFVNSIYKDDDFGPQGGVVLGIAGGVPGPAYVGASYRSGVAIATFGEAVSKDYFGSTMAHEVGHYLGLFHSSEQGGDLHDTLSDTLEDDPSNLMFWAYSPQQQVISEHQGIVIRSHPLVLPDD